MFTPSDWEPILRAALEATNKAINRLVDNFAPKLQKWLDDILNHPIPEDWRDELAAFVQRTADDDNLAIAPHSIAALERLIEARIAGTGRFATFGPAPRTAAPPVAAPRPMATVALETAKPAAETEAEPEPLSFPSASTSTPPDSSNARSLFDQKLASAKGRLEVLRQLLEVAGEKIDAAKPGEEADIDYEAAMIGKYLLLYNDDLVVAHDLWLRFYLSGDDNSRLIEMHTPVGLGLPMFANPAQAERARQQGLAISRRLNQENASMDAWVTGIATTEMAANAASTVLGAGLLIAAAKQGGRWVVIKAVAAGAAALAVDKGAEAGLRGAGASEQTIRGVQLAAAVITLILLRKAAKRAAPQAPPPEAPVPPETTSRTPPSGTPPARTPPSRKPPSGPPSGSTPPKSVAPPPKKPPLPPPQSNPAYSWEGHRTAAEAEELLARTVHDIPDEVVVRWGDPIGTHGSDVISVNIKTGKVTLWDSKFRSGSVSIKPSTTFQKQPTLDNAIREARETIKDNTTLPADIRDAALRNLDKRQVTTRTVGAGNARNSTLK